MNKIKWAALVALVVATATNIVTGIVPATRKETASAVHTALVDLGPTASKAVAAFGDVIGNLGSGFFATPWAVGTALIAAIIAAIVAKK